MSDLKVRERKCQHCGTIVKYTYGTTPQECPSCGSPHWNKPREEYKLFTIQDEYIANGHDLTKLAPMYEILVFYAENIIKRAIKGKVLYSPELLNEKAQDTALNFFESYYKKPNYEVHLSFGGILSKIALGVLYNPRVQANDDLLSLDYELDEKRSLGDTAFRFMANSEDQNKQDKDVSEIVETKLAKEAVLDDVMQVVTEERDHIRNDYTLKDSLLYLAGLRVYLQKSPKCTIDDFYAYWGDSVKLDIDNSLSRIHSALSYR